uniref:Uncharacterized protein n=1 Tax=Ochrobactrum phage ORM_20 TaxID=2985243 RepID=A0A9N6ZHQ0_9VIRU|nr:hypothetical protein ORM20_00147 [Ochrobactrum phage ORM_20]
MTKKFYLASSLIFFAFAAIVFYIGLNKVEGILSQLNMIIGFLCLALGAGDMTKWAEDRAESIK